MNASLLGHFIFEQGVYHSMPCGLHFADKGFGGYVYAKVCLLRHATLHGFVVCMQVRVVLDIEVYR